MVSLDNVNHGTKPLGFGLLQLGLLGGGDVIESPGNYSHPRALQSSALLNW